MSDANVSGVHQIAQLKHLLNRLALIGLMVIPFGGMFLLTITVLVPSLKKLKLSSMGLLKAIRQNNEQQGVQFQLKH